MVSKVVHVAVLSEAANSGSLRELKEVLPAEGAIAGDDYSALGRYEMRSKNNAKLQSNAVTLKGEKKFATKEPTISSITINCGSFWFSIPANRLQNHTAPALSDQ